MCVSVNAVNTQCLSVQCFQYRSVCCVAVAVSVVDVHHF